MELVSSYSTPKITSTDETDLRADINRSVVRDDKDRFINLSSLMCFTDSLDDNLRKSAVSTVTGYLYYCCRFDSINCATALVNGELGGVVAVVNEFEDVSGMSALHIAASYHAARCVELLLKKRARTDVKTKDGRGLLALELCLSSNRIEVKWNPDEYSVEDLVVKLSEKDLTTVKLLSEKTKALDDVAYKNATEGHIVALAALLIVAAEKVNESILVVHDADLGTKEKTTVYEAVIREALASGRTTTSLRAAKRSCTPSESDSAEKRKLLLCEIELLQLFGAVAHSSCTDKKVTSPLILATQAGDEAVIELLLKSNIDVNDADAEGNSALHCSLKTSMGSSQQQIKIVQLLLKHGARVSLRNKLGLTALHIAAGNGNSEALQVLLMKDPDCINSKTILEETPLFFAVKSDHINSAELLLRWGASSEDLNLRRERPIDSAKSQDMRFLLNPANISRMNRAFPIQRKCTAGDKDVPETYEELLSMTDEFTNVKRILSTTKAHVCKYFESPSGCIRGAKCFYAHGAEELQKTKQGTSMIHSSSAEELKRKVFVGGLPLSLDSDRLSEIFEGHFGAVEDAVVAAIETEKGVQSRGFGFVTFKQDKSVSAAVEAHYVTIMGKQVEIKTAVPKHLLLAEFQRPSVQQQELKHNDQSQAQAQMPGEKTTEEIIGRKIKEETPARKVTEEMPFRKTTDDVKPEQMTWVDRLIHGQPKTSPSESKTHVSTSLEDQNIPKWLRIFRKWLPVHLKDVYKPPVEGEYALSSLKADFRAKFGIELDHSSLGYSKLSDFMRTFPKLCHLKAGTIGRHGSPNHMILLPTLAKPNRRVQPFTKHCSPSVRSANGGSGGDSNDLKCPQDLQSVSNDYAGLTSSSIEGRPFHVVTPGNSAQKEASAVVKSSQNNTSSGVHSRFLQFLKPDPLLYAQTSSCNGDDFNETERMLESSKGMRFRLPPMHLVLLALAIKKKNTSVFFLREFDFYENYRAGISQGKCFSCNQRKMVWANFPCQHLLWCGDCKPEVPNQYVHKCVVCDMEVERMDLIPSNRYCQPLSGEYLPNLMEFPPLYPCYTRMQGHTKSTFF